MSPAAACTILPSIPAHQRQKLRQCSGCRVVPDGRDLSDTLQHSRICSWDAWLVARAMHQFLLCSCRRMQPRCQCARRCFARWPCSTRSTRAAFTRRASSRWAPTRRRRRARRTQRPAACRPAATSRTRCTATAAAPARPRGCARRSRTCAPPARGCCRTSASCTPGVRCVPACLRTRLLVSGPCPPCSGCAHTCHAQPTGATASL